VVGTQVLFSVWDTRVQDFEMFVKSTGYDAGEGWKNPGFKQGPTYPVVYVSWKDAKAFCEWLTKTEQASGRLPQGSLYRLTSDQEWSVAVGLLSEPGNTPLAKDSKIKVYPWGTQWPPPAGAGNYCGEESKVRTKFFIEGYKDDYVYTNPVGSFAANQFGLYDMGATSGSCVRIGMTLRRSKTMCCAVRRGSTAAQTFCWLHIAAASPLILVTITSAFVVLWLGSLRGKAGLSAFALLPLKQPRSAEIFSKCVMHHCFIRWPGNW